MTHSLPATGFRTRALAFTTCTRTENRLLTNSLTRNAVGAALMFSRQLVVQGNVMPLPTAVTASSSSNSTARSILDNVVCGPEPGILRHSRPTRIGSRETLSRPTTSGSTSAAVRAERFRRERVRSRNTDQIWQPPFEARQGQKGPNAFSRKRPRQLLERLHGQRQRQDGIGDTPYHETDVFGYIVDRHPEARVLAHQPGDILLRKGEQLMPVADTTGVTDLAPLMQTPKGIRLQPDFKFRISTSR